MTVTVAAAPEGCCRRGGAGPSELWIGPSPAASGREGCSSAGCCSSAGGGGTSGLLRCTTTTRHHSFASCNPRRGFSSRRGSPAAAAAASAVKGGPGTLAAVSLFPSPQLERLRALLDCDRAAISVCLVLCRPRRLLGRRPHPGALNSSRHPLHQQGRREAMAPRTRHPRGSCLKTSAGGRSEAAGAAAPPPIPPLSVLLSVADETTYWWAPFPCPSRSPT